MTINKLWQKTAGKSSALAMKIEDFTVGNDRVLDMFLAPYDVLGTLAHIEMLQKIGLLSVKELNLLRVHLKYIFNDIQEGKFEIREGVEDVHSEIEFRLTEQVGDLGKKVHSGRSRNDQILVDLKLYTRDEIKRTVRNVKQLFNRLLDLSEEHKGNLLPGYTHMQMAMISSFGQWFAAYAESLVDDVHVMRAGFTLANKNPLGSGAGYGGSLPLNRTMTTELLGFETLNYNAIYAQMNRGKMEKIVANGMASIAATIGKMSMDICLYMNENFGFISFPDSLTTGSSIMPHKKNPDVFELIRAKCNQIQNLPQSINSVLTNLPSGYHRDLQQIKEPYLMAFNELNECINICRLMLDHIIVKENILKDDKYKFLYSVEAVNELVMEGMPFREAYHLVGREIEEGTFKRPHHVHHTHEGSIGNLNNNLIRRLMEQALNDFNFEHYEKKIEELLNS